jgi:anti-sigma B factor antagonist
MGTNNGGAPGHPVPFDCHVIVENGGVRLAPSGELDIATTPTLSRLVQAVREAGFHDVTIDLAEVSFADARPLRLLLELDEARRAGDIALTILPGPTDTQRVFEVTGTVDLLPFRR